ncbi:MAG: nuclear transport factor 2 family protein [Solirubrobacterales bacterium]
MSDEKSEWARRGVEAWNKDPLATMIAFSHPDLEFHQIEDVMGTAAGVHRGHKAIATAITPLFEAFMDFQADILEVIDIGGDSFVMHLRHTGRGRASGVVASIELFHVMRVRDGKLYWWQVQRERQEALEAAGLSE